MMNPATVLVVDDDHAIRRLVARRVEQAGYAVVTAETGEQAIETLSKQAVDAMVLDVMMPGIDGFEVLRRVRQTHAMSVLPVIILSARDKGPDVIEALRLGANDYATKPVDFDVLMKRLATHLSLKTARGKSLGGYRILHKIGSGGMGVVYAAQSPNTERPAALKVLPRSMTIDEVFVQRFMREGRLASRVDHPNVVRVYDAGREDETYFIAMELVEGKTVAQIRDEGPIDLHRALAITRQVGSALEALRVAGIIHRDIKPENIIVTSDGTAKLTDFGIAREVNVSGRMTDSGIGVGSVLYASPEQIRGEGDFRSDIYSLGCTLFFMLTGQDPFDATKSVQWILRRKLARPPRITDINKSLPEPVAMLVDRMLAPRPERRFQGYTEIYSAVDILTSGGPLRRHDGRRTLAMAGAIAAGVILAGLAIWQLWRYG
ncbi:MAG: protein kinase [Deltaproteobacteria bacterium]|nr:protein kinase [Deltaproteobacteria bacterium]